MPSKLIKDTHRNAEKRDHSDKTSKLRTQKKFANVNEISAALRIQNQDVLIENLTTLRNQLFVKPGEDPISPLDERLLLVQSWMENTPGAHDLFEIWDGVATQQQKSVLALVVSILSSLLTLLSSHYTFQVLGQAIIKTLLTPTYLRRLNSYISGSHNELILITLKLFNVMSSFAGGRERKAVLEGFGWEIKSLPKLLKMRRKSKAEDTTDLLSRPDIRTLYILLLLSFINPGSSTQTKTSFIEQHRDAFLSIFKGLAQDPYSVVRKILETCWTGIWTDPKLKRTLKIGLFSEITIAHMLKLYERTVSEDAEGEHVPADLVHHFLLAICTRPGTGICFKDRGWYPRETEEERSLFPGGGGDEEEGEEEGERSKRRRGGRIHNKILANVLKTLRVNEDLRQQELALKILGACPELVAGYWSGASLTLEPRLSSKWIANVAFFGSAISLPVPSSSFLLPHSSSSSGSGSTSSSTSTSIAPLHTLYNPTPPPLSTILENVLPSSINTKSHLSKGLQSPSGLVQHCSAIALAKCLRKYEEVVQAFRRVEEALGEALRDGEDGDDNRGQGMWWKRRRELEREVRRRVPEFQVVVAFSQQHNKGGRSDDAATTEAKGAKGALNLTRAALLGESAMRLLGMYQRCLPLVVAEAKFDVGKLLQGFSVGQVGDEDGGGGDGSRGEDAAERLNVVRQLHVLRLLKDSDQFGWSGKLASSSQSYLSILFKAYTVSEIPAIRTALSALLQRILSESILFQEDTHEPHLWLISLPTSRRAHGTTAESPDGALLTDEADGVIAFLDDCVQRCLKTPYRYIEELYSLSPSHGSHPWIGDVSVSHPSPLLMTVLEQLGIKTEKGMLSASDVFGVVAFVRRLGFRLLGKVRDLEVLRSVCGKVEEAVFGEGKRLFEGDDRFLVVVAAVRREVGLFRGFIEGGVLVPSLGVEVSEEVKRFLSDVEKVAIPTTNAARVTAACELVDWLRLVNGHVGVQEIRRVSDILGKLHMPSISLVAENVDPALGCLWDGLDVVGRFDVLRPYLQFDFLFLHAGEAQIVNERCREILSEVAIGREPTTVGLGRAVSLISHRLSGGDELVSGLFFLLASILKHSSTVLSAPDYMVLKELVFVRSSVIKSYLRSESVSDVMRKGLHQLISSTLDSTNSSDRALGTETTAHWLDRLGSCLPEVDIPISLVSIWIDFFRSDDLFGLLDTLAIGMEMPTSSVLDLLRAILATLSTLTVSETDVEQALRKRLPQLLALRPILPDFHILEGLIAVAIEASLPAYCNGRAEASEQATLDIVVKRAEVRWSRRLDCLTTGLPIESFLDQDSWSASTVRIVSGLIYQRSLSKAAFVEWLGTEHCVRRSDEHFVLVMHAFLDVCSVEGVELLLLFGEGELWKRHFSRLLEVILGDQVSRGACEAAGICIELIMRMSTERVPDFLEIFLHGLRQLPVTSLQHELSVVSRRLVMDYALEAKPLITALVEHGVQWAVRLLGNGEDLSFSQTVDALTSLVPSTLGIKPHYVETLVGVVVRNHLSNIPTLRLVTALLSVVHLKPVVVNRHLQSIIQHPDFFKLCAISNSDASVLRDAIVNLLHVMFNLHPTNTCQVTHVEPLVQIYRGTLSPADGQIISIFRLFELERKVSVASLLGRWSSSGHVVSATPLEAIRSLDAILVLRTCLNFPQWRKLGNISTEKVTPHEAQLYDPVFLMLLFAQTLAENPPVSAIAWVELFRTNIVGLLIRALSSRDGGIRDLALCQLAALSISLQTADMQEVPHVVHLLSLLKDVLPPPSADELPKRLPSYTTLLLLHALRGVFYPSNFIYPITARFLLQRSELDISDVPMLYSMLYSSSDAWKKERGWIIRFLSDGMTSSGDWRVLKGRHTWDLLASLFQGSEDDRHLRAAILEVLANLTRNAQATTSLILKSGLLAWIEIQLITSMVVEGIEWVKILDNIMTVVSSGKLETSTNGEWRTVICRCLSLLLDSSKTPNTSAIFPFAASAILRLSLLPGASVRSFPLLLDQAVDCLKRLEPSIPFPPVPVKPLSLSGSLYKAHAIHEQFPSEEPWNIWGASVEALWRATMTVDEKSRQWDMLSSRLLVWRALIGPDSSLGEWSRKEVIRNIAVGI